MPKILDPKAHVQHNVTINPETGCWEWRRSLAKDGYACLRMCAVPGEQNGHRIAYKLWKGDIPKGMCVCHSCDVRHCVNPEHLFLGTQQDNVTDMEWKGRGRQPRGEAHGSAKLTEALVRTIRSEYASGDYSQQQLGDKYGCDQMSISRVVRRKTWAHVV